MGSNIQPLGGSLRWRLVAIIALGITLLTSGFVWNQLSIQKEQDNQYLRQTISQTSQLLNITITPMSSAGNLRELGVYLDEMLPRDVVPSYGLSYILLLDSEGHRILNAGMAPVALPEPTEQVGINAPDAQIHVRQRVLLSDNKVGYLQYGYSFGGVIEASDQILFRALAISSLGILGLGAVLIVFGSSLGRRIERLTHSAHALESGNLEHRTAVSGHDEIAQLGEHFNRMAVAIGDRIVELETAKSSLTQLNDSLEVNVRERTMALEQAHRELADTEKLASLGSMVAGISHELNTPIGNALTVTTTLESQFEEFAKHLEQGTMRRSSLSEFIVNGIEMTQLAVGSVRKAAELVSSFKQIAVDQTSAQRRKFDLAAVIDDNVKALRPSIRNYPLSVVNMVPPEIVCDTFPGPLGQIITNIVMNAAVHATSGRESCTLVINAEREGHDLAIYFADDGVGMPESVLVKVFDPFFTTKLGKGGSGLGLSVSHRIASAILGGKLSATSVPDVGTTFKLKMPALLAFRG